MNEPLTRALSEGRSDNLRPVDAETWKPLGGIATALAREATEKRAAREDVDASTSGMTTHPNPARK